MAKKIVTRLEQDKEEFVAILRSLNREDPEDIDYLLEDLESWGFFDAPASCRNHSDFDGGLLRHSLNTYKMAKMVREQLLLVKPSLDDKLPMDSVIIASLLHDVCKSNIYIKTERKQKTITGEWESQKMYNVDYTAFPMGHGEKSVIMLLRSGFELTDDEMLAIRWHMGAWDLPMQSQELVANLNKARDKCPLLALIQIADTLAANLLERDFNLLR